MSNNERIIQRTNQRKKKNKRKKIVFRLVIGCLFLCIGVVSALALFFNINQITVTGDVVYSESEIIKASGIEKGDNLIFLSSEILNKKISEKLPYVNSIRIKRRLPSTLEIVVEKTEPFMAVESDGYYILLNADGKVLEKNLETVGEGIVLANLGEFDSAEIGEIIGVADEKALTKIDTLKESCEEIGFEGISLLDVSDLYNIKMVYQDRITLVLGETRRTTLSSRLAFAKAAIETQNEENDMYRGTLNLIVDGKAYWSEEVPTTAVPEEEFIEEEIPSETQENVEKEEEPSSAA